MRVLETLFLAVCLTALGAAPVPAQQSSSSSGRTMSASAIDAALADHRSEADQQRAQLADLLARDEVREMAQQQGIDMGRVESAAAGLSDAQVKTVSPLVAAAMAQDEGGGLGHITISVAALIVILLVLILVT
ncbi:MAG TPA: PA2779 family protein [Longimicrobiales bacterium]|nr:PA2779 family protein [Longimicrobiales bacterium]